MSVKYVAQGSFVAMTFGVSDGGIDIDCHLVALSRLNIKELYGTFVSSEHDEQSPLAPPFGQWLNVIAEETGITPERLAEIKAAVGNAPQLAPLYISELIVEVERLRCERDDNLRLLADAADDLRQDMACDDPDCRVPGCKRTVSRITDILKREKEHDHITDAG